MMKRALCIWLPNWPIQRLLAARPELKQRPIVLHEASRGVERVMACSRRAMAMGITIDMPLAEAAALAGVPQGAGASGGVLVTLHYDPLADREVLETLAEHCRQFSPSVGLERAAAPECLLLDVTGLAHLFGGEAALARIVFDDFTGRKLFVRLGLADTLGAAWAVSHFSPAATTSSGDSPSPITIVPPGQTLNALRALPIAALRLPPEVVKLLHSLGVDRICQLEALPREELSSRFGPALIERWDQSMGQMGEPLPSHKQPAALTADWSPEHPAARRDTIEAAVEQLIGQVASQLAGLGRGAMRVRCRLDCQGGRVTETGVAEVESVQLSVGLFQPTAAADHLFQLVRMQLERLRLPAPVTAIEVSAPISAPLPQRQQELFVDGAAPDRSSPRRLAAWVDRLSSRLGRRAVLRVRLLADAQPEFAWRYDPLLEPSRRRGSRKAAADLPPRPLRLLQRPVPLAATAIAPDGSPWRFPWRGREYQIARTWGPERIETGWWRGRTVGRDYYRTETTTGRRFWLFRRRRDGRWFMHGLFE